MLYSTAHLRTAGKITVYTTLIGVIVFAIVFISNLGVRSISPNDAQAATTTTSVNVLNTPPSWTQDAQEAIESSDDYPTNVGDTVSWNAIGTDANNEDYYLLICSDNATPTPQSGTPYCTNPGTQWAVSTSTTSGLLATAATTTLNAWNENNVWYAWICDGNGSNPRCVSTPKQGTGTTSSPFSVNHRPTFTVYSNNSPSIPGATVTFTSTSADPDTAGGADTVRLFVCTTQSFNVASSTCTATTLASTTIGVVTDATAQYTIIIPTQDNTYTAYGYVIDNHGFEAIGGSQGTNAPIIVSNVAPTIDPGTLSLNGGTNMSLSILAGETTGFSLSFTAVDNNSCKNSLNEDEITGYNLSVYQSGPDSGNSSTTCTSATGDYDPNFCYPSELATTTWNLSCTASTTSCTGNTDSDMIWDCTFPLWFIARSTDPTSKWANDSWRFQVRGIDDDSAVGPYSESLADVVDVNALLGFNLNTPTIPYGDVEPGFDTVTLRATTTIAATGNVGLDKTVSGTSMCATYSGTTPCPVSATSTIPVGEQHFGTSTATYSSGTPLATTTQEIEVNVLKTTGTTTPSLATGSAFWGIAVPGTISFSGAYTGENTIFAVTGESNEW